MKIVAIIQARMASSRLPAKIMLDLYGKTVLERVIENVSRAHLIDEVIVATSINDSDDIVANLMKRLNIKCFRGDSLDVLDRFYSAARWLKLDENDIIVRITADCPLHDSTIIDQVIDKYLKTDFSYVANLDPPTYPDGLDCEVFSVNALNEAHLSANLMSEREHVTTYIRANNGALGCIKNSVNCSHLRWTLDEKEDYYFISKIYYELVKNNDICTYDNVMKILNKHPNYMEINKMFSRNEGFKKSLEMDYIVKKEEV